MRIDAIKIRNFRNIRDLQLDPGSGINLICGENAQGKTNFVEAIWLFSGMRSFRGAKDSELVAFEEENAFLEISFFSEERSQTSKITLTPRRHFFLNEVKESSLCGILPMSVFSPSHLSLVRDGPAKRRQFLDEAIGQLYPTYSKTLSRYSRALEQRGALLREIPANPALLETLDAWDAHLARTGSVILRLRLRYSKLSNSRAAAIYAGISSEREQFSMKYLPSVPGIQEQTPAAEAEEIFRKELRAARQEDLARQVTSVGPHRDELEILLDQKNVRQFGSQGQQRSCVLALKLAECGILEESTGKRPIILLDDVLSELDRGRRNYLMNRLDRNQIFITCCEGEEIPFPVNGKRFFVERGMLKDFSE